MYMAKHILHFLCIWVEAAFSSSEFEYFYPFTFMNTILIYQKEAGAKNISISSCPSSQTLMRVL